MTSWPDVDKLITIWFFKVLFNIFYSFIIYIVYCYMHLICLQTVFAVVYSHLYGIIEKISHLYNCFLQRRSVEVFRFPGETFTIPFLRLISIRDMNIKHVLFCYQLTGLVQRRQKVRPWHMEAHRTPQHEVASRTQNVRSSRIQATRRSWSRWPQQPERHLVLDWAAVVPTIPHMTTSETARSSI